MSHLLDDQDPLKEYRDKFLIPYGENSRDDQIIYFLGNSLGLQPKKTQFYLSKILENWHQYGVEAFFYGDNPWMDLAGSINSSLAGLINAKPAEVAVMNALTVNLHLALVSFYQPDEHRYKVIMEENAFPSDVYAIKSQMRYHGVDPKEALVFVPSPDNQEILEQADIEHNIEALGDSLALTLFSGINYYTGQVFDMQRITKLSHEQGAMVGWDHAHAIGNIDLDMKKTDADFAVWCHYKYLNSGPGAPGGLYINERHHSRSQDLNIPRFEGWWGNKRSTRFLMADDYDPAIGASGWQLSTPSPIALTGIRSSLDIVEEAGFTNMRLKSKKLTGYMRELVDNIPSDDFSIITPEGGGAQISLQMKSGDKKLFEHLMKRGVYTDWREPDVVRSAPVPLYNTFDEIDQFAKILQSYLNQ